MESCVQALVVRHPELKERGGILENHEQLLQGNLHEALPVLKALLCHPGYTMQVGSCFRPCLLPFISVLVEQHVQNQKQSKNAAVAGSIMPSKDFAVALLKLLELAPHISSIVAHYFEHCPGPHSYLLAPSMTAAGQPEGLESQHHRNKQQHQHQHVDALDLAFASLLGLQLLPELRKAWGAGPYLDLLLNENEAIRWVAIQALGIQLDLSDSAKTQLCSQYLTVEQQVTTQARWQSHRAAAALESARMWLPRPTQASPSPRLTAPASNNRQGAGEVGGRAKRRRKHSAPEQLPPAAAPPLLLEQQQQQQQQQPTLALPEPPGFVAVCGVDLPRRMCNGGASTSTASCSALRSPQGTAPPDDHAFVATPTVARNLRAAALALCAERPLLLEGPPGCGKTRLIQQLADLTQNTGSMVHIHLDDQMDAKSLLGAYVCTAVPGEFAWQPGPLTQAVTEGRWVVIEDINMAPPDVLAALVPLLESRTLTVASRGEVLRAEPGFQLIATVTSAPSASGGRAAGGGGGAGAYATSNMAKELLGSLWTYVRLAAPASQEQLDMLAPCYPTTLPLLPAAIAMLELVHLAGGQAAPPVSHKQQQQQQEQQGGAVHDLSLPAGGKGPEGTDGGVDGGSGGDGGRLERPNWWQSAAASALAGAGLRPGELALVLGRHFSVRDLFKWAARMQSLHSTLLAARGLHSLASAAQVMMMAPAATTSQPHGTGGATAAAVAPAAFRYDLSSVELRLREAAFVEGADIVGALVPGAEARRRLLKGLAGVWALPAEQAVEWYEILHKPTLNEAPLEVVVGRAVLNRQGSSSSSSSSAGHPAHTARDPSGASAASSGSTGKKSKKGGVGAVSTVATPHASGGGGGGGGLGTFARTGHAMRLMERVAVCLAQTEPVLLVGETGTGKTTLVSRLASLCGRPLVAFNMSQQTDSGDLLGGFKPVEARDALGPLLQPFVDLTRRTWTKGNNEEFLLRCTKYAEKRRWSHLVQAFHTALAKVAAVPDAPTATPKQQQEAGAERSDAAASSGAAAVVSAKGKAGDGAAGQGDQGGQQRESKRRKVSSGAASGGGGGEGPGASELRAQWRAFAADLATAERAAAVAEGGFAFAFVEGKLVQALREGWWLLLDEINLAPAEVLERIAGLLEGAHGSITLVEKGDTHTVTRHPGFRLIAAMNPATDAGKRELPAPLRNRFTEIWVPEPSQREDLRALVHSYLAGYAVPAAVGAPVASGSAAGSAAQLQPVDACVELYVAAKAEADMRLTDGAGSKPAYSLRTLCRALDYARTTAPHYGLQRALYDGFSMAFATQLSPESEPRLEALLQKYLLPGVKNIKSLLRTPPEPAGDTHVLFEHFWLKRGPLPLPEGGRDDDGAARRFVLTPSVKRQLVNLARAVLVRKHPILLQGPTSSGKTSLVGYLAAQTGHKLVRINNHEHTDLQEYLGSYVADSSGRLAFREGALVTAVREGHWVVLDELNLAPSDVLEALNRLLDDNRELFVPELNEVVKPHPAFMLFATQNPPGAYAGRKALSRAFRSRFLELHIEDIPDGELAEILERRCALPASYAKRLVTAMRELQRRRQATNVFAGKHGFITPRDLFKWAERGAVGYQALAEDGALILGERLRSAEERQVVADVLARVMNAKVDLEAVFAREGDAPVRQLEAALQQHNQPAPATTPHSIGASTNNVQHSQRVGSEAAEGCSGEELQALQQALRGVVWTRSMRRMYTLVDRCLRHMEPVLLVGETGTGKTTVCQLLALMRGQRLHVLNCNQHTETSDFLGGFRPARGRDRALASFGGQAAQVLAHPLVAESGAQVPIVSDSPSVTEVPIVAAQLQATAVHAAKWVQLQQQQQQEQLQQQPGGKSSKAKQQRQLQQQQQQMEASLAELQGLVQRASDSASQAVAPFVWVDGPLVTAMRRGDMLLVDEINLAEDAVLERLNSVLEPGRTLTLAERGGEGAEVIVAAPGFRLLATMNPGGDYGKKELSPALANRFTTVWVPALEDEQELEAILAARMGTQQTGPNQGPGLSGWELELQGVPPRLLAFWRFFRDNIAALARCSLSVRDLLAWATFVKVTAPRLGALAAYVHGAHLTLLDGLGAGVGLAPATAASLRAQCASFLRAQLPAELQPHARLAEGELQIASTLEAQAQAHSDSTAAAAANEDQARWGFYPFYMPVLDAHGNPLSTQSQPASGGPAAAAAAAPAQQGLDAATPTATQFELSAPTTARNAFRLLRALQLRKAVLVEGSPGVGKTALVGALASRARVPLVRINLSEQTDMMDLLGADLPSAGGEPGQFTWCDGPLLAALKTGQWVLLDELNLASQSVLEGLNALLDHRAEVFIPELGATYRCHPRFRLFAAQNPLQEGGGRKGLPRSFLNRFTRVYAEALGARDLRAIASKLHPRLPLATLDRMIALLALMGSASAGTPLINSQTSGRGGRGSDTSGGVKQRGGGARFAAQGGPWEFNLRDLLRWADLTVSAVADRPAGEGAGQGVQLQVDRSMTQQQQQQQQGVSEAGSASGVQMHARLDEAAEHYAHMLFVQRLRTPEDRAKFGELFGLAWGRPMAAPGRVQVLVGPEAACVGRACIPRMGGGSADHQASGTGRQSDDAMEYEELQQHGGAGCPDGVSGDAGEELHLLDWQLPLLESMSQALARSWMVLLVGGPGCGKTRLARLGARLAGRTLIELPLTSGTDTSDLLGSFEQVEPGRRVQEAARQVASLVSACSQHLLAVGARASSSSDGALAAVLRQCKALQAAWHAYTQLSASERRSRSDATPESHTRQLKALQAALAQCKEAAAAMLSSGLSTGRLLAHVEAASAQLSGLGALLADESSRAVAGRFEWVDGVLARAIVNGGWVLMDNANLCNPTVLDRLNPLLEPNGVLYMNECGSVGGVARVLVPHPDFRLILALDPRHGEVSRAMRNRGIELCLLPPPLPTSAPTPQSTKAAATDAATAAAAAAAAAASAALAPTDGGSGRSVQNALAPIAATPTPAVAGATLTAGQQAQQGALCVLATEGLGAGGPRCMSAMAHTHAAVCVLATGAHRRPPGLGALGGWARLARILAQRGWDGAEALTEAWHLAYLGSLVLAPPQLAAANTLLKSMLSSLGLLCVNHGSPPLTSFTQLQPCLGAPPPEQTPCHTQAVGSVGGTDAGACGVLSTQEEWCRGDGDGGWGGVDTACVAHIDLTTSAHALPQDTHTSVAHTADKAPAAAAAGPPAAGVSAAPRTIRTLTMAQPAVWPRLLSGSSLAADALTTTAERDVLLLAHLVAACAAHDALQQQQQQQQGSNVALDGLAVSANLRAASALPVQQRQLLSWLPPQLVAVLLQPQGGAQFSSDSGNGSSSSRSSDLVGLQWAAWVAGKLIVERCTGGAADAAARLQWVRELAAQAQDFSHLLHSPSNPASRAASSTAQLTALICDVVQQLLRHPLFHTLRIARSEHLSRLGAPTHLHALQPLDPRFCYLTAPCTQTTAAADADADAAVPSVPDGPATTAAPVGDEDVSAATVSSARHLRLAWLQWQGLTRAVPQWLLQQHAASQADAAVGAGCETPYQSSCWRAPRPEARALHAPPFHPVVDALAPLLQTITDVEQVLLALPIAPLSQSQAAVAADYHVPEGSQQQVWWTEEVAAALERVAKWRGALWGLCHGPLHTPPPPPSQPLSPADAEPGSRQHQHHQQRSQQHAAFDIEAVSWVWRHLDKALSRLVQTLPALLSEDATILSSAPHAAQPACNTAAAGAGCNTTSGNMGMLASQLAHARREGGVALGMQSTPCKPLLWRLGGRPLLPRAPATLEARLRAAGVGKVAGLAGACLGAVDARGYPVALAAGLAQVGAATCAAAEAAAGGEGGGGVSTGAGMDVDGGWRGVEGLVEEALHAAGAPVDGAEGATEARESVSRAVAAVLATDAPLRRAVAQGLAMLAFIPVAGALAPPPASQSPGSKPRGTGQQPVAAPAADPAAAAAAADAAALPAEHASEVMQVLVSGVLARARATARAAAALCAQQQAVALVDDIVSMGLTGAASDGEPEKGTQPTPTSTAGSTADGSGRGRALQGVEVGDGAQLLPARFMASPACRALQEGLLALQDVHSLRVQAGLLSAASQVLAGWAAHTTLHGAPPTPTQCAPAAAQLLRAVRAHMDAGVAGSGRLPADFAAHQQLVWVLEEMVAQGNIQQAVGETGGAGGVTPHILPVGGGGAPPTKAGAQEKGKQQKVGSSRGTTMMGGAQWDYLHAVVLPALLHELRLPWHSALWACCTAAGSVAVTEAAGPSLLLHSAARALVAAGIAGDQRAGSVQAREARLWQLCLGIRHFLHAVPPSLFTPAAHLLPVQSSPTAAPLNAALMPASSAHKSDERGEWVALASLAAHTLLAHAPSLPNAAAAAALSQALQQLMAQACQASSLTVHARGSSSSSSALTAAVAQVGAVVSQSNHLLLRSLLQPLILPALEVLAHGATLQQQQQQQCQQSQQAAQLVAQGKCWALLGEARLQLLVPPPGVDPAGKYATKARWLRAHLASHIAPEEAVRKAAQHLPGGPDESLPLSQLAAQRADLGEALTRARVHAVPRPQRSRYAALRAEIAGFADSLGGVGRVCTLVQALSPAPLTAASAHDSNAYESAPVLTAQAAAALQQATAEAGVWQSNAGAWVDRLGLHFPEYLDLVQPVQLAVQEVRHGLALLCAAASARAACTPSRGHLAAKIVSGLMAFPPQPLPLPTTDHSQRQQHQQQEEGRVTLAVHLPAHPISSTSPSAASLKPLWLGSLAEPTPLKLVVEASILATSAALPSHLDSAKRARAAEMAAYTARLRAGRVALRALARALISAGPQAALALLQPSAAAQISSTAATLQPPAVSAPTQLPPHILGSEASPPGDGGLEPAGEADNTMVGGNIQLWAPGFGGVCSDAGNNSSSSSTGLTVLLGQLEGLLCGFVGQWSALKAHEERVAAEEAEMFKTKVRNTTMLNEEEEAERDFLRHHPAAHSSPFADIPGLEEDMNPAANKGPDSDPMDTAANRARAAMEEEQGVQEGEATDAQANSKAARQLLDGEALADIVHLHAAVFSTLSGSPLLQGSSSSSSSLQHQQHLQPHATQHSFAMSYELGAELLRSIGMKAPSGESSGGAGGAGFGDGSTGGGKGASAALLFEGAAVDEQTLNGHLFRLCCEHAALSKAAAATSADAAAAAFGRSKRKQTGRKGVRGSAAEEAEEDGDLSRLGIDIQAPCVEEIVLLQEPVRAMSRRLVTLLAEFPEHPVLAQLMAIASRCLGLPAASTPLKTALTGLELLLARAQVWEETAAKYVSVESELTAIAALATRWRRLELASWRGTLARVAAAHAAGARHSWFHLYQLLVAGLSSGSGSGAEGGDLGGGGGGEQEEVPWWQAAKVWRGTGPGTTGAVAGEDGGALADGAGAGGHGSGAGSEVAEEEKWYRRSAATLEAFLQTSTVGEYEARLQLLGSFHAHLQVRQHLLLATSSPTASLPPEEQQLHQQHRQRLLQRSHLLQGALANTHAYYAQFVPSVRAAIAANMAPHEKDLAEFVALAKWEDRGYYALRASAEKAQRHLHKLRRRGEEVLRQPAAGVLATTVRGMGVPEFASAARTLQAAEEAAALPQQAPAAAPPKGATAAQPQSGNPSSASALASAAKARRSKRVLKARAAQSLLMSEAAGLEAGELMGDDMEWQDVDPVVRPPNLAAWAQLCAAAKRIADAQHAQQQQQLTHVAGISSGTLAEAGSSHRPLQARLRQLTNRLSSLLSASLAVDPTATEPPSPSSPPQPPSQAADLQQGVGVPAATTLAADAAPGGWPVLPGAVAVDELAATAAAMSVELRGDVLRGCRLRKRKALADFLGELQALGLSKRQADVPQGEREVVSWFKHPQPNLAPLFQPTPISASPSTPAPLSLPPADPSALASAAESWTKAGAYYYRAIARMHKLWAAAVAPHKDVSLAECATAQRCCEHLLLQLRRQRAALGEVAAAHAALQHQGAWAEQLCLENTSVAEGQQQQQQQQQLQGLGPWTQLPPQQATLEQLQARKAQLDCLEQQAADTAQLLDACAHACASPSPQHQALLERAAAHAHTCAQRLGARRTSLATELAATHLRLALPPISQHHTPASHQASSAIAPQHATSVCWASQSSWLALTASRLDLEDLAQDAVALAAGSGSNVASEVCGVPGMAELAAQLHAAAAQAVAWEAEITGARGVMAPRHSGATNDNTTTTPAAPSTQPLPALPNNGAAAAEADAFSKDMEAAVSAVLIWAQGLDAAAKSAPQETPVRDAAAAAAGGGDAASAAAGPKGLLRWTDKLEAATQVAKAHAVVHSVARLLQRVSAIRDHAHVEAHAPHAPTLTPAPHDPSQISSSSSCSDWQHLLQHAVSRVASLAPLLALARGALQLQGLRWVDLHRACAKLAYISAAIFGTLMEEGFCGPQDEGQATEGGDGEGDTQEVQGTGMGEGDTRGAKDVSDKIDNEDQLLGSQQKDQPPEEQGQQNEDQGQEDNQDKGVEMDADFEGTMQDLPKEDKQDMDEDEDEEGDADHIDQQMGDVGDNEQVVDEKLWNSEDEDDKGNEQGKDKKEEQYDDRGAISVDDKKDLDYEAGRGDEEEDPQDKGKQDQPKAETKKDEAGKQEEQGKEEEQGGAEEGGEEEEEEEGAGVNDADDRYADRQDDFVKPEAQEEEMQLPEDMNLDGGEEGQQEEEQQQQEEQQGAGDDEGAGEEQKGTMDVDDEGNGKEGEGQDEGKEGQNEDEEGGEELPSNKPDGGEQQPEEEEKEQGGEDEPKGGIGEQQPEEQQGNPEEPPPETEPAAAHGLNEEEGQKPPEAQQAGPQGVKSSAPTQQQALSTGRAAGEAPQQPQAEEQQEQPQAGEDTDMQDATAPETAATAQQAQMGRSGAHNQRTGAPAPQQAKGGGAEDASQPQEQRQQQQRQQQRPEPNPLRNLGDAMERWKANLAVKHEAPTKEEEEKADGTAGPQEEEEEPPEQGADDAGADAARDYQFLQPGQQKQAGDTQALAPATEEQAKELDDAARQQQDNGPEDPQAGNLMEEDAQEDEQAGGDDEGAGAQEPMPGVAPKQWQGAQRDARMQGTEKAEGTEGEGAAEGGDTEGDAGLDEAQMHAQLMERLFGPKGEGEWGGTEGGNTASVRAPGSMEEEQQEAEAARKMAGTEEEAEEEEQRRLMGLLAPEEAQALREQLDARLQDAAAGVAPAGASSAAGLQYGNEVWARCEALTAGLAGELAEQLRLILEPTQASKLAGDYRTGKRISMRKVIAYIASHFRKDKIWLRRSRPDKRRYQVLLAVDDSRSMAECGCGGMALEALTLLCKSMSRLEVGQIGVLKFGGPEGAVPLHSLSQPFSDAAGPGIMSSLRFDQDNTIGDQPMLRLMETLEHTLELARHEGGAGGIGAGTQDLAQLVLVVADGRLHEKEGLRTRVRELAAKRGVCLAFIAIDAQATTNTAAAAPQSRGGSHAAGGEDNMETDVQGSGADAEQQGAGSGGAGGALSVEPGSRAELRGGPEKAGGPGGSGSSLLDMQTVSFVGGKPVFRKYMDDFPFPYYVLLRDIGALPRTLADMLRQWFEMSASS